MHADSLTVPEVAKALRVDETTVRRWVEHGVLEAIRLPAVGSRARYLIPTQHMIRYEGISASYAVSKHWLCSPSLTVHTRRDRIGFLQQISGL